MEMDAERGGPSRLKGAGQVDASRRPDEAARHVASLYCGWHAT
jgi:hypothetical protein